MNGELFYGRVRCLKNGKIIAPHLSYHLISCIDDVIANNTGDRRRLTPDYFIVKGHHWFLSRTYIIIVSVLLLFTYAVTMNARETPGFRIRIRNPVLLRIRICFKMSRGPKPWKTLETLIRNLREPLKFPFRLSHRKDNAASTSKTT